MAWTKAKLALTTLAVGILLAGTTTLVVKNFSTSREQRQPEMARPGRSVSQPNPNARFANLTAKQRVEQARRHFPESVDDLKK